MILSRRGKRMAASVLALAGAATLSLSCGTAQTTAASLPSEAPGQTARNVILVIGDGMSDSQILASRYVDRGRDRPLAMETVPHRARAATFSHDELVTDSAAAGSAMGSGTLVANGSLNVDPSGANRLDATLGAAAKRAGKGVGLISTRDIANATPAAFGSALPDRDLQSEIAAQYLTNGMDVLLGGGESFFLPQGAPGAYCPPPENARTDNRNLFDAYTAAGYAVARDRDQMLAADGDRLLGVFNCTDMNYDRERAPTEPTITEMTDAALRTLERNPQGFFLMVEGGMIDPAAEDNDGPNAMGDTIALDRAVERVLAFAGGRDDTLVVVTADHEAGGMALVADDRLVRPQDRYTTADGRPMSINWATQPGHTGAPIPVRAAGPGAERLDRWVGTEHLRDLHGVLRDAQGGPPAPDGTDGG